VPEIAFFV